MCNLNSFSKFKNDHVLCCLSVFFIFKIFKHFRLYYRLFLGNSMAANSFTIFTSSPKINSFTSKSNKAYNSLFPNSLNTTLSMMETFLLDNVSLTVIDDVEDGFIGNGTTNDVLMMNCTEIGNSEIYSPICGTDLQTYKNICHFEMQRRTLQGTMKNEENLKKMLPELMHNGECCVKDCPFDYNPVCDNRGDTHLVGIFNNLVECVNIILGNAKISFVATILISIILLF